MVAHQGGPHNSILDFRLVLCSRKGAGSCLARAGCGVQVPGLGEGREGVREKMDGGRCGPAVMAPACARHYPCFTVLRLPGLPIRRRSP